MWIEIFEEKIKKTRVHRVELYVKVGGTNVLKKEHSMEGGREWKKNMQNSF